jgi:hypothetical protein
MQHYEYKVQDTEFICYRYSEPATLGAMKPPDEAVLPQAESCARPGRQVRNMRWWIVGVLFCGSLVNYLDRVALSIVAPQIRTEFGLTSSDYALILNCFMIAYALSYGFGGKFADWIGTRASFISRSLVVDRSHPSASRAAWYRSRPSASLLGLGEAGYFPSGVRAYPGVVPSLRPRQSNRNSVDGFEPGSFAFGPAGHCRIDAEFRLESDVSAHGRFGVYFS